MAGTAARFDAATDRVSYVPGTNPPDPPFTVAMWVYLSVDSGADTSLYRRYTTGGSSRGQIGTSAGSGVALEWFPSGVAFGYSLTQGAWSRVAVVVDAAGNLTTYAGNPTGALTSVTGSAGTTIGVNQVTLAAISVGNGGQPLNGRLARVRTWAATLTEIELEAEFAATSPIVTANLWADWPLATDLNDASGNARHLTAGSTAVTFDEDGPPAAAGGDVSATMTGAGGGAGAVTATREVTATATGNGGGVGAMTAVVEDVVLATGTGSGGGAGQLVATREVSATMSGAGGGVGALVVPAPAAAVVEVSGSWWSLVSTLRELRDEVRREENARPVACPNDGTPLESHRGVLHCPFDGWTDRG